MILITALALIQSKLKSTNSNGQVDGGVSSDGLQRNCIFDESSPATTHFWHHLIIKQPLKNIYFSLLFSSAYILGENCSKVKILYVGDIGYFFG